MKKIIYLPFEELPQRYTKMWNDSIISMLSPSDIVVWGKATTDTIEAGEFLDTYGTIAYKSSQMGNVARSFQHKKIQDGDIFFVPDIFYPSLESIRYMAELSDIKVKIVAFNHAGRADEDDFVQKLNSWSDGQEKVWHDMCDMVMVGSEYQKERVQKKFHHDNVKVTGAVWSSDWMQKNGYKADHKKQPYVIYPHRPSKEKQFDLFLDIANNNPSLHFVITSCGGNRLLGVPLPKNVEYRFSLSKKEYYDIFSKAECYLSTAKQETFGYTLQEAIYFGCKIIVPDYACYREYAAQDSILTFDEMRKRDFLTQVYESRNLCQSKQHTDNAGDIIKIIKTI